MCLLYWNVTSMKTKILSIWFTVVSQYLEQYLVFIASQ